MNRPEFLWDPIKETANQKKHGVSFQEAQTASFYDENGRMIHDPDHSENEDRFILLGMSTKPRVLMVCHCYRSQNSVIRIISARRATRNEQKQYGGVITMRKEYDFSKSQKNPYAKMLKKQITIRIEDKTIDYFKELAVESGVSYQNLINMVLRDCAQAHKKPVYKWSQQGT